MPKVISTTIEDEVTFLTNVDVEYVSLVRHGANRTPFRILKSDKGGSTMEKVVTAVLIPKSISEDDAAGHLEGYRSDEVKEYDTYKSYIQVDHETIDPETAEVIFIDKEAGILGVVASLVTDKDEGGDISDPKNPDAAKEDAAAEEKAGETEAKGDEDPKVVEKESLDYATMDELYMELYAMADIVGGALRQSQIEPNSRKSTVLTAIDNFRTFASMVLDNAKSDDAVKSEDHPNLAHHLPPAEKEEDPAKEEAKATADADAEPKADEDPVEKAACVCPSCGLTVEAVDCKAAECPECKTQLAPKAEKAEEDEPVAFDEDAFMVKVMDQVKELLEAKASTEDLEAKMEEVSTSITESAKEVQESLKGITETLESLKDVSKKVADLSDTVDKIENTPRTAKADVDEELDAATIAKESAFQGTIFSNFRSQEQ